MAVFNAGSIEATLDLDLDPFQRGLQLARGEGRRFAAETFTAKLDVDTRNVARRTNTARRALERAEQTYTATFEVKGLGAAAAQAAGLQAALAGASGDRTASFNVDAAGTAAGVQSVRRGVMALIPALAILATGLIPLTAAAVPVLGLANNLTLAAGAAGAGILAFQGVGDALKAANEAGAEPTAENLAKLHAAMSQLTPEAREFVTVFRDMREEASALQKTAAQGFLPGINAGLESVDLNQFRGLVSELSRAGGANLGAALEALDDPRWLRFFDFVEAEAKPGIDALGSSVGNLAGFFANLWMAFDPLNDDFSDWLVRSTADMDAWAGNLPDNPEFLRFVAYVREVGPEAAEAMSALGGGILDVVVAAAPLGGTVLNVLEAIGNAVSTIADSPLGPTILTGAAALYTFNRALAITDGLMRRAGLTSATGAAASAAGVSRTAVIGDALASRTASIKGLGADLGTLVTSRMTAGASSSRELARTAAAADRVKAALGGVGKAAGGIGAIALLSTGAAESLGLTQTATLGLAGAMMGPLGAAVGATAGLLLDFRANLDNLRDSQEAYADATRPDFTSLSGQMGATDALKAAQQADLNSIFGKAYIGPRVAEQEAQAAAVAAATERTGDLTLASQVLAKQLGVVDQATMNSQMSLADLDAALVKAQPAMMALGISTDDLAAAAGNGNLPELVADIVNWQVRADSAAGRTQAFADSVRDLGMDALSTAESASAMSAALEALLSPQLNLEAATDQWRVALLELEKQLKSGAGFDGMTKAAVANREMTRGYVEDSMARLTALAEVGTTTEKDMADAVAATRREFIQSGIAAGFSRKEIAARAKELGLTPKMVRTVFEAAGIDAADLKARELRENYRDLPNRVQTAIRTDGVPQTMEEVNRLVEKYELTEKERRALVTLRDLATGPLQNVGSWLNNIDGKTATATVRINTVGGAAAGAALGVRRAMGGPIYGPGTGTSDSVPAWLSNGEHVWTAREVANAGGHAAVEAMREQFRYAAGGALEWRGMGASSGLTRSQAAALRSTGPVARTGIGNDGIDRLVEAIRANRGLYVKVSSREELEQAFRLLEQELRKA